MRLFKKRTGCNRSLLTINPGTGYCLFALTLVCEDVLMLTLFLPLVTFNLVVPETLPFLFEEAPLRLVVVESVPFLPEDAPVKLVAPERLPVLFEEVPLKLVALESAPVVFLPADEPLALIAFESVALEFLPFAAAAFAEVFTFPAIWEPRFSVEFNAFVVAAFVAPESAALPDMAEFAVTALLTALLLALAAALTPALAATFCAAVPACIAVVVAAVAAAVAALLVAVLAVEPATWVATFCVTPVTMFTCANVWLPANTIAENTIDLTIVFIIVDFSF